MFLRLISLIVLSYSSFHASGQDNVSSWLQRMGCDDLLALYLENQLEHGTRKEQIKAANQLADVYAFMLARATGSTDTDTLKRAIALFERIPEAGTTDLRLQLYRATYIASEQMLERYRLRISLQEEAEIAMQQLHQVVLELDSLRTSLLKRARSSKSRDEKKDRQIGLITSYLAWAKYYIAWYERDIESARDSAQLFAEILRGEKPSLQSVSLDLKAHDTGARSILGIALCKSIILDPSAAEPWFDELEDPKTWSEVKNIVPLWKYFLLVDERNWDEIQLVLDSTSNLDQTLVSRVAAVHALENYSTPAAKKVAKNAIESLINQGQLGIVRDVISVYGDGALDSNAFIAMYIRGDIEFQNLKDSYPSEQPAIDETTKQQFSAIAEIFSRALKAHDAENYTSIIYHCHFRLGISLFYAGRFSEAATSFRRAFEGNSKEQTVWMALVCLNHIAELTPEQENLKNDFIALYLEKWPNSEHAAQLTIHKATSGEVTMENVNSLLAIPRSAPEYEQARRQAARMLYSLWQKNDAQHANIGNKYISLATTLLAKKIHSENEIDEVQIAIVRTLRILEISLHTDVLRLQAAENALQKLDDLSNKYADDLQKFKGEINYREMLLLLLQHKVSEAANLYVQMSQDSEGNVWAQHASNRLWNALLNNMDDVTPLLWEKVGSHILSDIDTIKYGNSQYITIASKTANASLELFEKTSEKKYKDEALRIARILYAQQPRIVQILFLNAETEMKFGDEATALKHWKTIASGTQPGSEQWLRARFNSINMLSSDSPQRALELLNQHVVLYPDYGGGEFGNQLQMLHSALKIGGVGGT